jgi:xanthine dehydrogenase accessory factor
VLNIYEEIVRLQREGRDCALCTIVSTQGSTPGKEMMKLLVREDGSFAGTVGGGCLEAEVLEAALASLQDERSRMLEFALNERDWPDSGLLCGGKVRVYVEPITEPKLYLFGGGHVSGAIARVARPCGFHVTVGDDRAEFTTAERHPDAQVLVCAPFDEQARSLGSGGRGSEGRAGASSRAFVVVCTRGHDEDGTILEALWKHGAAPRYLGMIGSRAKRATLYSKLREAGVPDTFLERVRSPMGLAIGARNHAEIAVSVVAEMIQVRRAADARPPIDPTLCT